MMKLADTDMRDAFFSELSEALHDDRNILVLTDDFGSPILDAMKQAYPANVVNTGICEQTLVSVAAGMALSGKRVFTYAIAPFMVLRCLEQIKIDLCCMNLPVTLIGVGAGYAYSDDGPTHHATEDIAVLNCMAGMEIYSPSDVFQVKQIARARLQGKNPAYIRLDRGRTRVYDEPFLVEQGYRTMGEPQQGGVVVVSTGLQVETALELREKLLEGGISCFVIDVFRLKPFNLDIVPLLAAASRIVTVEEHSIHGGLAGIVSQSLHEEGVLKSLFAFGISDKNLYAYGTRANLQAAAGISVNAIYESIQRSVTSG